MRRKERRFVSPRGGASCGSSFTPITHHFTRTPLFLPLPMPLPLPLPHPVRLRPVSPGHDVYVHLAVQLHARLPRLRLLQPLAHRHVEEVASRLAEVLLLGRAFRGPRGEGPMASRSGRDRSWKATGGARAIERGGRREGVARGGADATRASARVRPPLGRSRTEQAAQAGGMRQAMRQARARALASLQRLHPLLLRLGRVLGSALFDLRARDGVEPPVRVPVGRLRELVRLGDGGGELLCRAAALGAAREGRARAAQSRGGRRGVLGANEAAGAGARPVRVGR